MTGLTWSWAAAFQWLQTEWRADARRDTAPDTLAAFLLGAAVCHRFGGIPGASELVNEMLSELRALQQVPSDRIVLSGLASLLPESRIPILDVTPEQIPVKAVELLFMDKNSIEGEIALWTVLTEGGRRPPDKSWSETGSELVIVLPSILMAECRAYDIELVSGLLRMMLYLGVQPWAIERGVEFLAYQQRRDGSFGFANPMAGAGQVLLSEGGRAPRLRPTVAALWALGEVEGKMPFINISSVERAERSG